LSSRIGKAWLGQSIGKAWRGQACRADAVGRGRVRRLGWPGVGKGESIGSDKSWVGVKCRPVADWFAADWFVRSKRSGKVR